MASTLLGATIGAVNGGVGYMSNQMDAQSALRTFWRWTVLGMGGGVLLGGFILQFNLSVSMSATLTITEIGGGFALWMEGMGPNDIGLGLIHTVIQHPRETVAHYRNEIIAAANNEGVPPELVAAVLLAELMDYDTIDLVGDDLMWEPREWMRWSPEEHSIGITQLRIDNVRNWGLWLPEFGPSAASDAPVHYPAYKIRRALEDPESSIKLLAQAVRVFAENGPVVDQPTLGLTKGQPVDFSTWTSFPYSKKRMIAWLFSGAKDDIQGRLKRGNLQGDVAYDQVVGCGLLGVAF